MKMLIALLSLLGLCSPGYAQTVMSLSKPSVLSITGHQCGYNPVISTATGFDGAYVTTYNTATTRCGGSGRGGGYYVTVYSGCAAAKYTLVGALTSITSTSPSN